MARKTAFFEGWFWFKFNNLGLALGSNLKFYTSVAKELKLKFRKFWGLIPSFVEVTGEKVVGGGIFLQKYFKIYIKYLYQVKNTLEILVALLRLIRGNLMELYENITKSDSICAPTFVDHHLLSHINVSGRCLINNISILKT